MLLTTVLCAATAARAQSNQRDPHIGYVYPGGGQRGRTSIVTVGGQNLRGATGVHVSGPGIRATVLQHFRPLTNLQREEREALQEKLRELIERQLTQLPAESRESLLALPEFAKNRVAGTAEKPKAAKPKTAATRENADKNQTPAKTNAADKSRDAPPEASQLPESPLLYDLEDKSLRELLHIRHEFLNLAKRRQPNAQIAESVLIQVAIDANAAPGDREIRLVTPLGLTNPMCLQVGLLPEVRELEPNDPKAKSLLPEESPAGLPFLVNGQVKPGDVDRFRFLAKRGQELVIEVSARRLVPYLADAVPGWFQATLSLYDAKGNEVAFSDDYRFDPDPVILYRVPQDGEHTLEIRDSIYRGREDFVYRIGVGEQPFITRAFPLGGRRGARAVAAVDGWNLPGRQLVLATPFEPGTIREATLRNKEQVSNPVSYVVDMLPESPEAESNDTTQKAQQVELPRIINGTISQAGDVDVFQFKGKGGDELVAEVHARRLGSPLDSLLRLTDASGQVLEWNDDHNDKESGLLTHHADSYLRAKLPADGVYQIQLADSQRHGGESYGYRLRLGPPRPDFALRLTPSSLNVRPGGSVAVCLHALRKDGFDGQIEVALKDAPAGFALSGERIPPGCGQIRMTLTAPQKPLDKPVAIQLEGRAQIGGRVVARPVVPAEDMMQAFLYRHLTPSRELVVSNGMVKRPSPPVQMVCDNPVRLPAGGTAQARVRLPRLPMGRDIRLELREPPKGVTLGEVTESADGLAFVLKAEQGTAKVGLVDNLIVEAFTETAGRQQGGNAQKTTRLSLGVLPAIPMEIVQR